MAAVPEGLVSIFDGDIIQLYCPNESGYVYSEPNSTTKLKLDICKETEVHIPDFAAFCIILNKELSETGGMTEKIVYGSVVSLEHQASNKFLTAENKKEVNLSAKTVEKKTFFRIVSSNQETVWGKELKDNDLIKLESISCDGLMVHFCYAHQMNCYIPSLEINSTMFTVKSHCHKRMKQNRNCIKGGSVIFLATLLPIEAYMCCKGSFVSNALNDLSEGPNRQSFGLEEPNEQQFGLEEPNEQPFGLEEPNEQQFGLEEPNEQPFGLEEPNEQSFGLEEPNEQQLGLEEPNEQETERPEESNDLVGLVKFMKGSFKKLPRKGDTFFQLEKVEGQAGDPILFEEQCRIKHLFTFKYITVFNNNEIALCDLNESNGSELLFKILPVSKSQEEILDSNEIIFQHVNSGLYLSVNSKPRSTQDQNDLRYVLTLGENQDVLQSQFKVSKVKQCLVFDCYCAIGVISFLCGCLKKHQQPMLDKEEVKTEIESKMKEMEEFLKTNEFMIKALKAKSIYEKAPDDIIPLIKQLCYESANENEQLHDKSLNEKEETDTSRVTRSKIDLHIQIFYQKFLERFGTEHDKLPAILKKLFAHMSSLGAEGAEELLMTHDRVTDISEIIDSFEKQSNDVDVHGLLLLLYFLNHTQTIDAAMKLPTYHLLFKLIAEKDVHICFMSAELFFDIYTAKLTISIDSSNPSQDTSYDKKMWELATMMDENSLSEKMLSMQTQLDTDLRSELEELSERCIKNGAQEEVFRCGLFHIILDYTVQSRIYSKKDKKLQLEVLKCCFKILQRVSTVNTKIQNELFNHFNAFLQFKVVIDPMICLMNEIFYKNSALCNKLTEDDFRNIFQIAIISGTSGHYQWTIVLQTIIEHSDYEQAKTNISQLIQEHSLNDLKHIFDASHWLELLCCVSEITDHDDKDENSNDFHLLINITNLLASCAKECYFARSVSMKLFDIDDLMKILVNSDVISYRKLPFIRILTWTYLDTGSGSNAVCSDKLKDSELWSHIKAVVNEVNTKKNEYRDIFKKSHWAIFQQVINSGESLRKEPSKELPYIMDLLYVIDGVIPFLSQFCHEMSSNKINCTLVGELKDIGDYLMLLCNDERCFVSKQLLKFECIQRINLLLTEAQKITPLQGSLLQHASSEFLPVECDISASLPNHRDIVELLKEDRNGASVALRDIVIPMLRKLIILQKQKNLSCLKRVNLEKTILRTLILLQELIKQDKKDKDAPESLAKLVLDIDDNSRADKSNALFDLLPRQNNDINVALLQVLQCLSDKFEGAEVIQTMIISSIKNHGYTLIAQVYQLLRKAHFTINKAKLKDTREKWNDTETTDRLSDGGRTTNPSESTAVEKTLLAMKERITTALDIISLLCDRQQKEMQNAMQENMDFISGSNVVSEVTFLLFHIVFECNIDAPITIIAQKAVRALKEMCTGNYSNQEIALNGQVVVFINNILEKSKSRSIEFIQLQSSCIKLLEIMLEEIDENAPVLTSRTKSHLKMSSLLQVMQKSWSSYDLCIDPIQDRYPLFLRIYHVFRRIADHQKKNIKELVKSTLDVVDKKREYEAMWHYCEHRSRSVEIVYKLSEEKEILTQAYFPYDPDLEIQKKSVQLHIKRETQQEKLLDLLKWTNVMKTTHKQKKKLRIKKCLCFCEAMLQSQSSTLIRRFILVFLTILLNLFVLFSVRTPADYNTSDNEVCTVSNGTYSETCNSSSTSPMHFQPIWIPEIPLWSTIIMSFLGLIHALFAVMMFFEYFARNWGHLKCGMCYFCKYICYIFLKWLLRKDCTYQKNCPKLYKLKLKQPQSEEFETFFEGFQPLYRLIFMLCSCLAWIPYPTLRYLYCVCMLYPFLHNDVMSYILRALKRSFKQLVLVFLLCFAIIYIYAVIGFALLNNYFTKERDQFCGSLVQCFTTILRLGLLSTLGSELDIRPSDDYKPDFTLYAFRTVYDIIFFIVITTLALNIIIAILVDRFSEMREKKDDANEDDEKRCFICGIERSEFDKRNKDFKKHVNEEHNMWNYIRFIIYVKSLSESEHKYNAVEKYVFDKMQEENDKLQPDTAQQNKGQSEAMLESVHVQQEAMEPLAEKKCYEKCCTAILSKLEQWIYKLEQWMYKLEQWIYKLWIYEPEQKDQKSIDFFPLFRAKALPDYKPSESVSEERLLQLITKTEQLEKALEQVKKEVEKAN